MTYIYIYDVPETTKKAKENIRYIYVIAETYK